MPTCLHARRDFCGELIFNVMKPKSKMAELVMNNTVIPRFSLNPFPFISATAAVLTVQILGIPDLDLEEIGEALEWVFLCILPNYCYFSSLEKLYTNHQSLEVGLLILVLQDRWVIGFYILLSTYLHIELFPNLFSDLWQFGRKCWFRCILLSSWIAEWNQCLLSWSVHIIVKEQLI